ncbi:MAG TPA: RES domain-containing protein [Acidimicrobiales bacterium]|nr:RES domain-containing protein [Acidimicrobiales bacterium]
MLVRVCRRGMLPWWFSSDGSGRFDLEAPNGTCYLATDAFGAVREASRAGPVTPAWVAQRDIHSLAPPDLQARLAAATRAGAGAYGLTKELVTILPYDQSRRWAAAFHRQGFAGIRHELRHDPRARPSGVALFGPAGGASWPGNARALTEGDVVSAGVPVLPVPPSAAVTIID